MKLFSELSLCSALRNNLAKNEFVTPTPVQAQAIPPIMEGRDVVATAQTGTGKTLAFAIPVIEALAAVPGAHLNQTSMRFARAYRAFLVNARLWRCDFEGAYLSEADLRGANLRDDVVPGR